MVVKLDENEGLLELNRLGDILRSRLSVLQLHARVHIHPGSPPNHIIL